MSNFPVFWKAKSICSFVLWFNTLWIFVIALRDFKYFSSFIKCMASSSCYFPTNYNLNIVWLPFIKLISFPFSLKLTLSSTKSSAVFQSLKVSFPHRILTLFESITFAVTSHLMKSSSSVLITIRNLTFSELTYYVFPSLNLLLLLLLFTSSLSTFASCK